MMRTRIEKDSLGEVHVPAEAQWGAQTQRAVENFPVSGLHPWRAFIWSMTFYCITTYLAYIYFFFRKVRA